jgi:geranylgeranyl pyrophosphate synthase
VLFASEEFPELNDLILRRFKYEGDAQLALDLIERSNGVERTRELANEYVRKALV